VHFRKPDADIFRIALDIALVKPDEVIYIEDRPMFVSVGDGLGINGLLHESYASTREKLAKWGFTLPNGK
jgi:putative hydrolase of the HAD superfamily